MPERIRFTKAAIEAIAAPTQGRSTVYDEKTPKLALRTTASGSKAFYVIKRNGAVMEWLRLGTFPDMTVENARTAAEDALGDWAKGGSPVEAKRLERQQRTFGEAFEDYFAQHVIPQGVKRADDIRATWERFLGALPDRPAKRHGRKRAKHPAGVDWSQRRLPAIDTADVRTLHANIGKTHRTYANRVVELVSTIHNRAIEWGYRGENPAKGIKPFKEAKRARFLNQHDSDELPRFFAALVEDTSQDFQHYILLSLLTGARRNNVLGMRWQDVNMQTGAWTIPETKNDEPLVVPLVPEAVEILKARTPKAEGFVFSAPSKSGHMTPPKKRWRMLLKRATVKDLRIHDLRRSLGSWQAISGASLAIIGKTLGHKSPDATMIYARLHLDPVRASMNTATSAMLEAAGVKKPAPVVELKPKRKKGA